MSSEEKIRFKKICKLNGVKVVDFSAIKSMLDKVSYKGESHFKNGDLGIVKAIAANSNDGNALIDVSNDFKLSCVIDVSVLYVLIECDKIYKSSYEAFKQSNDEDYLLFVGAESKTADIEKQLISGVQGAREVVFVLV